MVTSPLRGRVARLRLARVAVVVAAALLVSAATWSAFRHGVQRFGPGLPVLGQVPEFSLVASDGQPLSREHLRGEVWVADFIFTQCSSLCPILSGQMATIQTALARQAGNAVRLVSFSVDPANDTPAVLHAYAQRFHADGTRWLFVTGDREALYRLIGEGFRLAVAERPERENTDGQGLITHSDRFVLVDRDLQIRGYYHGTEEASVRQLLRDIEKLQATGG